MKSIKDQKSLNLIFDFYSQHKMTCSNSNCSCNKIEYLIKNKRIELKSEINEEDNGYLINDKDILEESNSEDKFNFDRSKIQKKKHLKLWGFLIEEIFEQLEINSNAFVKIEFSNFLSFYLEKFIHSQIEISYIAKKSLSFHIQFYLYYSKKILLQSNKKIFESEIDVNFLKILEYNYYYEKFLKTISSTSEMAVGFWEEMQKNIFKPRLIETKGYYISKNSTKLEKYSKIILEKNPNDLRIVKVYGTFLNHILNLTEEGKNLTNRAFMQVMMNKNEIERTTQIKNFIFPDDVESSIIIANGNKENIGRIEYVNNFFTNLFGYQKEEIVGKNLSILMPRNVGKYHNQFMLNFYNLSKPKNLNQVNRQIGLNKEKLIHPIIVFIKILPFIEEGIAYIGIIRKSTFSTMTRGPRHIRNNLGYIMTTVEGELLHYNKEIEKRFQLTPYLMFDDTKDQSEVFKIEMIFPELIEAEKQERLKGEELRLFFTTKVIEVLKRMEYSQVNDIIKRELNNYYIEKQKVSQDIVMKSPESNKKNKKNKKTAKGISISYNIETSELYKKNTANVSVTKFSYRINIKFLIYQIVFERGIEQNLTNIIKKFQQKFEDEMKKKGNQCNNKRNLFDSVSTTIQSSVAECRDNNTMGNIVNLYTSVRNKTFKKKAPNNLNIITGIYLIFGSFLVAQIFLELAIVTIFCGRGLKGLQLVNSIQKNFFAMGLLQQVFYFYGLFSIHAIEDRTSFNKTLISELYYTKFQELITFAANQKDDMIHRASYDKEIANTLTESNIYFKTYYDEYSYTLTNNSLVSSIIILLNYYDSLFSYFKNNNTLLDYKNIIPDHNGNYLLQNDSNDIQKTVVKGIISLRENLNDAMQSMYLNILNRLIDKNIEKFNNLEITLKGYYFIIVGITIVFWILYSLLYISLIKKRVNMLLVFIDIDIDTIDKCLTDVKNFNSNIDKIIRDDIFFLNIYYSNEENKSKREFKRYLSSFSNTYTGSNDFNLGLEPESSRGEVKQVFKEFKKKEMISIKEFLEDKRENENNIQLFPNSPLQGVNLTQQSFSNQGKSSDTFGSRKNLVFSQNNKRDYESNSTFLQDNIKENSDGNKKNQKTTLFQDLNRRSSLKEGNQQKEKEKIEVNVVVSQIKKRAYHRKAQLKKIEQYKKRLFLNKNALIITFVILVYCSITFTIPFNNLFNMISIFTLYKGEYNYKLYVSGLFPTLTFSIVTGEITQPDFANKISNFYKNISKHWNENNLFLTKNKKNFKNLYNFHKNLQKKCLTCEFIFKNYKYTPLFKDYCYQTFFLHGNELGLKELVNIALEHFNYISKIDNLKSIEVRRDLMGDISLQEGVNFNLFIVDQFYNSYLDTIIRYLSNNIENLIIIFIIKLVFRLIIVVVFQLIYFKKINKTYLNSYIYNRAMLLLIPKSEIIKPKFNYLIRKMKNN